MQRIFSAEPITGGVISILGADAHHLARVLRMKPGEELTVGTHVETLTENTRVANSRFFNSMDEVPTHALTMGIGSILSARRIVILASGVAKYEAIKNLMTDKISTNCPATLLKVHPDVTLICDREAFEGRELPCC